MTDSQQRRVELVCTAPNDCFNGEFTVVDDRSSDELDLTCTECGHTQTWELSND